MGEKGIEEVGSVVKKAPLVTRNRNDGIARKYIQKHRTCAVVRLIIRLERWISLVAASR